MSFEERDDYGMYRDKHGKGPAPELMGAVTLVGAHVRNAEGEHLGVIKELMVDMASGAIAYVLLSAGRFLAPGEKLLPVPWRALGLAPAGDAFLLAISSQRLAAAPAFDTDHWPDMSERGWAADVSAWYGTSPQPER
jgi:sporulation protein YlmC with PRC-barrel domain